MSSQLEAKCRHRILEDTGLSNVQLLVYMECSMREECGSKDARKLVDL
jgi:hypothetical protein